MTPSPSPRLLAGGGGHRGAGGRRPPRAGLLAGLPEEPVGVERRHPVHRRLRRRREAGEGPRVLHRRGAQGQEGG